MRSKPGTLATLNEQTTQDIIVNRLSPDLNQKWYDHRYERLEAKGAVPFEKFANWIKTQADIQLGRASAAPESPKKQSDQQLIRHSPSAPPRTTSSYSRTIPVKDPNLCVVCTEKSDYVDHRTATCDKIVKPKSGDPTVDQI